jgi:hypothetical protein
MPRKSTGGGYPPNWKDIATQVKTDAGWRCVRCGAAHNPPEHIHHLNMRPQDSDPETYWWNLASLCARCHLTIQAKVVMERIWYLPHSDWFKPYVAGWSAHVNHLPTDKEFVMQHIDELIAIGQGTLKVEEFIP